VHEAEKSLDGVGTNEVDVHLVASGSLLPFLLGLALFSPLEGRRGTICLRFHRRYFCQRCHAVLLAFDAFIVSCYSIRVDHSFDWGL
jgi:hypothetical protein